ncbi:MAG TPA: patatin-like phospholipase family protein, partial [Chloroflexota bacterium]|nr:patatin-like phospholipase family protein [Chloroflexota bacterium]
MAEAAPAAQVRDEKRVDLVFEGGGVRGIALVGALAVLEEHGFQPQNLAGSSAGAIVATLSAAGYRASELRELIGGLDFRRFKDTGWEDRVPWAGQSLSILRDLGIYEGDAFRDWMAARLEAKGVRTFGDLVHPDYAHQPRYRYRVRVLASDVTGQDLLVLPQDALRLGTAPDDLNVAQAVRMSMSIPIFFEPVRFRNARTGLEHLIVDGGLLSNFPVWLFDSKGVPEWPTFGLKLVEPEPDVSVAQRLPRQVAAQGGLEGVIDYLKSMAATMMEWQDRIYIRTANFARTIAIPTLGVSAVDFDLSTEQALALYESGRIAAEQFLTTWDFQAYIAAFRTGTPQSRRRESVA